MIGNNSCGVDRADVSARSPTTSRRLEVLTYDGLRMWVGPTSDEEYAAIQARGRAARARSTGGCGRSPRRPRRAGRRALPRHPAPRLGLQPRRPGARDGLRPRPRAGGLGVDAGDGAARRARPRRRVAPAPALVVLGLPRHRRRRARRAARSSRTSRIPGGHRPRHRRVRARSRACTSARWPRCPRASGWLMAQIRRRRPRTGRRARAARWSTTWPGPTHGRVDVVTDPDRETGRAVRHPGVGAWPSRRATRAPGRTTSRAGRTPRCPPTGSATTCAEWVALLEEYGYSEGTAIYGHFGHGCIHTRIPFDLGSTGGRRGLPLVHGALGGPVRAATAGRSPASTATASRAASCCERMFGPGARGGLRVGQGALRPAQPDEPRQGRPPLPAGREPADRRRLRPRRAARPRFSYPSDDGRFTRAVERCIGVGRCRRTDGRRHVPLVPGHRRGAPLHARPRAAAVGDAARARGLADHRRLAVHRGPRRPRPVPGVQGLPVRLPGQRRHGDLQGRVPAPPLRGPAVAPPALAPVDGLAAGAARVASPLAPLVNRITSSRAGGPAQAGRRHRRAPLDPRVRDPAVHRTGSASAARGGAGRARRGAALAGHVHRVPPPARRRRRRRACSRRPGSRCGCPSRSCAAA